MASHPNERASIFREETMRDAEYKFTGNVELTRGVQNGRGRTLNYRPASLRTLSLSAFFLATVVLIGVLQYAIHELPHGKNSDPQSTRLPTVRREFAHLIARNETTTASTLSTTTSLLTPEVSTTNIDEVSFVLFTPSHSSSTSSSASASTSSASGSDSLIVSAFSAAQTEFVAQDTTITLSTISSYTSTSTASPAGPQGIPVPSDTNTEAPALTTAQAAYVSTLVTVTLETTTGVDSVMNGETVFMSAPESQYVQTRQTTILITTTPSAEVQISQPTTITSASSFSVRSRLFDLTT